MRNLSDRVARLETAAGEAVAVIVWRETGETADEAVARYRLENPAERERPIMVIGWLSPEDERGRDSS